MNTITIFKLNCFSLRLRKGSVQPPLDNFGVRAWISCYPVKMLTLQLSFSIVSSMLSVLKTMQLHRALPTGLYLGLLLFCIYCVKRRNQWTQITLVCFQMSSSSKGKPKSKTLREKERQAKAPGKVKTA